MMLRTALTLIFVAEISAFLDQSQLSDNTTSASLNNSAGAAGRGCQPNCQNCTLDSFGNVTVCHRCTNDNYMDANHCEPCSEHCQRNMSSNGPVCRHDDGVCLRGCQKGYYGLRCDKLCHVNCLVNSSSDLPTCDMSDGTCTFGCKDTYYGRTCNSKCSNKCEQELCERDGVCSVGCSFAILGGPKCDQPCSVGCAGRDNECDQQFRCLHGCKLDYWGSTCQPCSNDCTASTSPGTVAKCLVSDGFCQFGCSAGKYGLTCSETCPGQCKDVICNQTTGECINKCKKGYYDDYCNSTCNSNCPDNDCYPGNGTCVADNCLITQCAWYGPSCDRRCPRNCKNKVCDRDTGHCLHGCIAGYSGDICDTVSCPSTCMKPLANDTSLACNKTTLACLHGCTDNFDGDRCDRCVRGKIGAKCDLDCDLSCQNCTMQNGKGVCDTCRPGYYYFNKNCEQCRSTCLDSNTTDKHTCDQNDGSCLYGCKHEWYGANCDKGCPPLCINRTCNIYDGCCTIDYCKYDTYGGCKCQTPCNPNCKGGTCHQNGTCKQGCKGNSWGHDCNQTCSINCQQAPNNTTSSCDRQGQCLFGCRANLTGLQCSIRCPGNCLHGKCDPVTMACLDGCVPGYFGRFCNETTCGDGGVVDTHNTGNTSSLIEIIFNRLDPKVKTIKIVFN